MAARQTGSQATRRGGGAKSTFLILKQSKVGSRDLISLSLERKEKERKGVTPAQLLLRSENAAGK